MVKDVQSRKYQITINNPDQHGYSDNSLIDSISQIKTDYFAFAREVGEHGTEHIHCFIYSQSPIRFSTIKNHLPYSHIEKAYGSIAENRDYIRKEGKWANSKKAETSIADTFYESGSPPEESNNSSTMSDVVDDLKSGFTTYEIVNKYPKLAFKVNDIQVLSQLLLSEMYQTENRELYVIYCYGDSGTGKTSSLYSENRGEKICRITSYDNGRALFDGYKNENIIAFEEYHSQIKLPDMLSYLDVYPLTLPARYSNRVACYTKVYILSNLPLKQQYTNEQKDDPKTWEAFLRRINEVRHYHKDFTYTIENQGGNTWEPITLTPFGK